MKYLMTGEKKGKRGKSKFKKFIALIIAVTMITSSVSYAASGNLTAGLKNWLNLSTGQYTNQSGFCIDDEGYCYLARIRNSDKSVKIYKYKLDKSKTLIWEKDSTLVNEKNYNQINVGHANDMTYCSRDKYIYICSKSDTIKYKNSLSEVLISDDSVINLFDKNGECHPNKYYSKKQIGFSPSGIAYDEQRRVFYLTQKKDGKLNVSVFDLSDAAKKIGKSVVLDLENDYTTQGITCKGNYLYVSLWDEKGQNNSLVVRYKIDDGNKKYIFKKDSHVRLDIDKNTKEFNKKKKFEIEGIGFVGNKLYMAVNADDKIKGDNKGDAIYTYTYPN